MNYTFIYVSKEIIDPAIAGTLPNEETVVIEFKCQGFNPDFSYYVRCLNGTIQYITGERFTSYRNWPVPPTEQEEIDHIERSKDISSNHKEAVQSWIDNL